MKITVRSHTIITKGLYIIEMDGVFIYFTSYNANYLNEKFVTLFYGSLAIAFIPSSYELIHALLTVVISGETSETFEQ